MNKQFLQRESTTAIALAVSVVSVLMAGAALYKVSSSAAAATEAAAISSQAIAQASRIMPWAQSRESLKATIQDLQVEGSINGFAGGEQESAKVQVKASERRYGDPASQFTLIEYSDYECPACKMFYEVPKTIVDGSRGNVSLVFKHVPVHGEASRKAAFAAECAANQGGNDAFFKISAEIFEETMSNGAGVKNSFTAIARRIGLNGPELSKCIDDNIFYEKVKSDFKEGVEVGVKVTPTTVVRYNPTGQQIVVAGAVSPEDILKAMSNLVQKPQEKTGQ